jgi:hypothetical protein
MPAQHNNEVIIQIDSVGSICSSVFILVNPMTVSVDEFNVSDLSTICHFVTICSCVLPLMVDGLPFDMQWKIVTSLCPDYVVSSYEVSFAVVLEFDLYIIQDGFLQ